jgi:hypothetical protein
MSILGHVNFVENYVTQVSEFVCVQCVGLSDSRRWAHNSIIGVLYLGYREPSVTAQTNLDTT